MWESNLQTSVHAAKALQTKYVGMKNSANQLKTFQFYFSVLKPTLSNISRKSIENWKRKWLKMSKKWPKMRFLFHNQYSFKLVWILLGAWVTLSQIFTAICWNLQVWWTKNLIKFSRKENNNSVPLFQKSTSSY